jgi:hypothetical protein
METEGPETPEERRKRQAEALKQALQETCEVNLVSCDAAIVLDRFLANALSPPLADMVRRGAIESLHPGIIRDDGFAVFCYRPQGSGEATRS